MQTSHLLKYLAIALGVGGLIIVANVLGANTALLPSSLALVAAALLPLLGFAVTLLTILLPSLLQSVAGPNPSPQESSLISAIVQLVDALKGTPAPVVNVHAVLPMPTTPTPAATPATISQPANPSQLATMTNTYPVTAATVEYAPAGTTT